MIIPPSIHQKHSLVLPYVNEVAQRVRDIVSALCECAGYAYLGRTKDGESLAEKIETGRFARWSDLDDLFACAVIVPTLGEEPSVLDLLRSNFEEIDCKLRGSTLKDPSVFRFDATRFIGRLSRASIPSAVDDMLLVRFEIQVRTAFEHAWSVTTHALTYKSAQVDWRHLRLAAQLRATVEQLDQVVLGFEQTANFITQQNWPEVNAQQLIWTFFSGMVESKVLPSEVTPRSWGRFSENLLALIQSSSESRIFNLSAYVERALEMIKTEVEITSRDTFPRSISLLQFCTGAMARRGLLVRPPLKFVPLITGELLTLFPEARALGPGFDFQFTS